ncbi:MAG: transcription termination/antitermination protein NusG, partial [bacterium]
NGVVRMLSNNGQPSQIPEKEIEAVQQIVSDGFDPKPVFDVAPGDLLKITSGPLTGFQGILREVQGRRRFIVTFEAIGQSVAVNIDPRVVRKVAPSQIGYSSNRSTGRQHVDAAVIYK